VTRINRAHIKTRELELQRELSCCPRLTLVLFFSLRKILKGQKETPTTTTKRSSLLEVLRMLSSLLTCSFVRSLSREEEEEEEEEEDAKRPPITEKSFDETQKATHYQQKAPTRRSHRPFSHSYHNKGAHKRHHQGFCCGFFCVGGWSLFATDHSERSREVHRKRLSRCLRSTVIIPTHSKRDRKSFTRMLALLQPLSYSYIKAFFLGVFLGVVSTCQINELVKQR